MKDLNNVLQINERLSDLHSIIAFALYVRNHRDEIAAGELSVALWF